MRKTISAVFVVVLVALHSAAHAQSPTPLQFGDVAFAMTPAQARTAFPNANWQVIRKLPSGADAEIEARDGVEFAGAPVNVSVRHERYVRELRMQRYENVASAKACLDAGKTWMQATRVGIGPLRGQAPNTVTRTEPMRFTTTRIEGALIVMPMGGGATQSTYGEKISLEDDVEALLDSRRGMTPWPIARWERRPPQNFYLSAYSPPLADDAPRASVSVEYSGDRTSHVCIASLIVVQDLPQPARQELKLESTRILNQATIGARHAIATRWRAMDGPAKRETAATVSCQTYRATGLVEMCTIKPSDAPAGLTNADVTALLTLARAYRFDMSGQDIDDPQPLDVRIPVRISDSDIRALDFASVPADIGASVRFAQAPRISHDDYPPRAISQEIEANLLVKCQVQTDYSIVCADARAMNPEHTPLFKEAALKTARTVLVQPTLSDGASSVGAIFEYMVAFRLD